MIVGGAHERGGTGPALMLPLVFTACGAISAAVEATHRRADEDLAGQTCQGTTRTLRVSKGASVSSQVTRGQLLSQQPFLTRHMHAHVLAALMPPCHHTMICRLSYSLTWPRDAYVTPWRRRRGGGTAHCLKLQSCHAIVGGRHVHQAVFGGTQNVSCIRRSFGCARRHWRPFAATVMMKTLLPTAVADTRW